MRRLIFKLGNGPWDISDLRTLREDLVPKIGVFDDFELEQIFRAIGRRVMLPTPASSRQVTAANTRSWP